MSSDHPLDPAAIGQLYQAHHSWLRGWLSRRTGCREHAADLAQETFVRLLNARKHQTLQQPRAYLSSIARSLMIDQYRRRELERAYLESLAHFPQVEVPSEETRLLILDSLERIDRLLDQLKPRVREAFLLAQLDGLACPQTPCAWAYPGPRWNVTCPRHCTLVIGCAMPNSDPRLVDQAIQWMIKLRFNVADDASTAAFEQWLQRSAAHQRAWQQVAAMDDDFKQLPAHVSRHALDGARQRISRREGLKVLGLCAGAAGLAWLGRDYTPLPALLADYRTATGERRWVALGDGSKVQLNSASAIDTALNAERRLVDLRQGEVLINTGGDQRPFWVHTRDGYLRALGTRLLVREEPAGTLLAVQQGTVAVFSDSHDITARQVIKPGEQVLFNRSGIHPSPSNGLDPWAWSDGVISAHNMRLDDFLAELGRYRNGLVRCGEAVAGLRVSGTYQLDDTDQVLKLVAQSLPVAVTYRSRYWVTVSARV